ncbi:MAG: integrin alpha, partial [Pseudomonadota bacterium]
MTIETIDLENLDGTNGFRFDGNDVTDRVGGALSNAGDINGDGIDDFVVGAASARVGDDFYAGEAYVVFGRADGFAPTLRARDLDGTNGFLIQGKNASDVLGAAVSGAGDINGDGINDIIIGADGADGADTNGSASGEAYVIFGSATGFGAQVFLDALDGTNGFTVAGLNANDRFGDALANAGDVNGDGIDDIIVGAPNGDPTGRKQGGEAFVIFGAEDGFDANFDLAALDGTNGFRIDGADTYDSAGRSVSSAGDINGDGIDDVIVGGSAYYGEYGDNDSFAEAFVVFGRDDGFAPNVDAAALDGTDGFTLAGFTTDLNANLAVSSAGDVNGDGFDDLIVGVGQANPNGRNAAGEVFVVFGSADGFGARFDVNTLDGTNGFRIQGADPADNLGGFVSAAGDFNGDGIDDLIIGAQFADSNAENSGEVTVIFGSENGFGAVIDLADIGDVDGVLIEGLDVFDNLGRDVSAAGDVNGDGVDDIVVGARNGDARARDSGEVFVIFGVRTGDDGADALSGSEQGERLRGLGGNDTLEGLGGDDTLQGGQGDDTLDGGEGSDTADFSDATSDTLAILLNRDGIAQSTLSSGRDKFIGIENLIGSDFNDRLFGDENANRIEGGDGGDTLDGVAGDDSLFGGAGNDGFRARGGDDLFDGGDDTDFVNYTDSSGVNAFLDGSGTNGRAAVGDTFNDIENLIGSATGGD